MKRPKLEVRLDIVEALYGGVNSEGKSGTKESERVVYLQSSSPITLEDDKERVKSKSASIDVSRRSYSIHAFIYHSYAQISWT